MDNQVQAELLMQIPGDPLENIAKYCADWRKIIDGFKNKHGRAPTVEELRWCSCEHEGRDIRKGAEG